MRKGGTRRRLFSPFKNKSGKIIPGAGFNIGVNCGVFAGQTIMHAHIHLIPRRDGDTLNPRGGVHGVIPGKKGYR
ncbi:MAG: HIT family protein [Deltaproteobacteria bacterium]|nr:HIT family protein [Deltaproteobacteria bacterium]